MHAMPLPSSVLKAIYKPFCDSVFYLQSKNSNRAPYRFSSTVASMPVQTVKARAIILHVSIILRHLPSQSILLSWINLYALGCKECSKKYHRQANFNNRNAFTLKKHRNDESKESCGAQSQGHMYNTTPASKPHHGRQYRILEEPEEQETCCETVSSKNVKETTSMKSHHHGYLN